MEAAARASAEETAVSREAVFEIECSEMRRHLLGALPDGDLKSAPQGFDTSARFEMDERLHFAFAGLEALGPLQGRLAHNAVSCFVGDSFAEGSVVIDFPQQEPVDVGVA